MHALDDTALLHEFAEHDSGPAFAELVARHVNKVYSVALRYTRNPHEAEEITQAVFVILARRAGTLGMKVILSGWLYQTARLVAVTYIRGEVRRTRREQEAFMQTYPNDNESDVWPHIAPLLDDAIARLREKDRHAVVLRFLDGKSMKEVGAALGASEDAAKMRVNRALERLRHFFAKRGVDSTAATIAETISANSIQAAPVALAKTVTAVALAKGATASLSTLTLIKGALKIMAWTKAKSAVVAGVVLILAVGTTTVILKNTNHHSRAKLQWTPDETQIFQAETSRLVNQAKISGLACFLFADANQNQWPKSFAQLKAQRPECRLADANWEFVSGGNKKNFADPSHTILFREKESRPSPDGKFLKIYALADGSVQEVSSPDDDFAIVEKKFGYLVHQATN